MINPTAAARGVETPRATLSPKDVIIYYANPGTKNFLISLRLRNEKGVLAEVSAILTKSHINILSGQVSVVGPHASWTFFAETSKEGIDSTSLTSALKDSKHVESVFVREDADGLLFDDLDFPVRWNQEERAVLFRKSFVNEVFGRFAKRFGKEGEELLYDEGYRSGIDLGRALVEKLGRPYVEAHLAEVVSVYTAVGWARVSLWGSDAAKHHFELMAEDAFDLDGSPSSGPHSQFLRGNVCGLFSALLNLKLVCKETMCIATGDRFCLFKLDPEWK